MAEIPRVLNVLLLDADGKRIAVKYFDEEMTTVEQQMAYERQMFQKTSRTNARGEAEIAILDKQLVVRLRTPHSTRNTALRRRQAPLPSPSTLNPIPKSRTLSTPSYRNPQFTR